MASRLFVGNVDFACKEDDLRALFQARWPVASVRIVVDRETGRSKGFGFVELEDDTARREAIELLDGSELFGRKISVREAHERPGNKAGNKAGNKPGKKGGAPKRPKVESKPEIEVATLIRRSSFRSSASITTARPTVNDGRRWEAPPEPDGVAVPAPRRAPKRS